MAFAMVVPSKQQGASNVIQISRRDGGAIVRRGAVPASAGQTFDAVKAKGFVQCAVNTGLAGFSFADSQGKWTGLDVDLCKAIAVAMFGDAEKVKFTPTTAQQRFVALQSGEVDVITRNATQTLLRDTSLGFNIAGVNFYDGQGFIVPAKSRHQERQGAERRHDLRAARHHDRAQPRGLFPQEQDDLQAGADREARRAAAGLCLRPLRLLHDRRLGPRRRCAPASSPARAST